LWQVLVGVSLAYHLGCQQLPSPNSTLGNLPRPQGDERQAEINASTYSAYAQLLERQGQFGRAAEQYNQALALQPESLGIRNRLGITLNKLGRHPEASEQFQWALARQPAMAHLHNNLGFSYYLEGKYAEAEAELRRALELNPELARAHLNRALTLARLQRFDEIFAELKLAGSLADAQFNMGVILIDAEQYEQASHYLEAAVALRPDFGAAQRRLREVSRLAAEARARRAAIALAAETPVVDPTSQVERCAATEATIEPGELNPDPTRTSAEASATALPVQDETGPPSFADEPGIDVEFLFGLIDEAFDALHNRNSDSDDGGGFSDTAFDVLWCRVGYYLFPETAPEQAEPELDGWLVDQRDLVEAGIEQPVGK
jgi:tetratricopeptide (TPR) repeat protein